jgi:hypothetical protein
VPNRRVCGRCAVNLAVRLDIAYDWVGLHPYRGDARRQVASLGWLDNVKRKLARNFESSLVRPVTSIAEKLLEKVLTYVCGFR